MAHQLQVITLPPAQLFVCTEVVGCAAPARSLGPLRPDGRIRGLGAPPARFRGSFGWSRARLPLITNDAGQGAKGVVHRGGVGKDLGDVGLEDDDMAAGHLSGVGIPATSPEVVLREDLVRLR